MQKKKRKKNSVAHQALGAPQNSEIQKNLNWPAPHLLPSSLLSPPLPPPPLHLSFSSPPPPFSSPPLPSPLLLSSPPPPTPTFHLRRPFPVANSGGHLQQPPAMMTSSSGHGDLLLR